MPRDVTAHACGNEGCLDAFDAFDQSDRQITCRLLLLRPGHFATASGSIRPKDVEAVLIAIPPAPRALTDSGQIVGYP
jgi:hypothetical protein